MKKQMLINSVAGQECRIAVVTDDGLEEYYVERTASASRVGNIYKGKITNVESAIQAAFIDFGLPKNGFLHISDLHPQYFPKGQKVTSEPVGRKRPHKDRPPIQACLRRGQEVIVQMTKEGIGTKGPTMTTYLSIPGRLLVAMPGMSRLGVSRKIEDEAQRAKARQMLGELKLPGDIGFIVRTAGLEHGKREMQRDLNYLLRLWKSIEKQIQATKAPAEIYRESDLVIRTIRDVYNSDIDRIICDSAGVARSVEQFLRVAMPRTKHTILVYTGHKGLFHDFGLEPEIERMYSRRVELSVGGSLVIDQTEALVAIDVNSGRFRDHSDAETTATRLNMHAAQEIARQLRMRDLGGLIVIDFIDMREDRNRRKVEKAFRDAMKPDRAKTKILRISRLGIVEMTRQRVGPSMTTNYYRTCDHCHGLGHIKSEQSLALHVMRTLQRVTGHPDVVEVDVRVTPSVAHHLANLQRHPIALLERKTGRRIIVQADADLAGDALEITCRNSRGSEVAWEDKSSKPKKTASLPLTPLPDLGEALPEDDEDLIDLTEKPEEHGRLGKVVDTDTKQEGNAGESGKPAKKSKRRRRGGRKHRKKSANASDQGAQTADTGQPEKPDKPKDSGDDKNTGDKGTQDQADARAKPAGDESPSGRKPSKSSRRRRRRKRKKTAEGEGTKSTTADGQADTGSPIEGQNKSVKTTGNERDKAPGDKEGSVTPHTDESAAKEAKPARRRRSRRKKAPAADSKPAAEDTKAQAPAEEAPVTIPPQTEARLRALFETKGKREDVTAPPPQKPPKEPEATTPEDDEIARRIRQKLVAGEARPAAAGGAADGAAEPAEPAPSAEEAPKKKKAKRRRKKKAPAKTNAPPETPGEAKADDAPAGSGTETPEPDRPAETETDSGSEGRAENKAAKRARKKPARKKAAPAPDSTSSPAADAASDSESDDGEPKAQKQAVKKARKRTTRKKAGKKPDADAPVEAPAAKAEGAADSPDATT